MVTIRVLEAGRWINYAVVPAKHVELYIRYALSRGYTQLEVV